jgi:nucleoside-diphosphate-sugar epimerase
VAKILISGSSGYIGKALLPRLLENGHQVTCLLRTMPAKPDPRLNYVQGDLSSQIDLGGVNYDTVIHLAAKIPDANNSREDYDRVNEGGTARLLQQVKATSPQAHFIHISSHVAIEHFPVGHPLHDYALSKKKAEALVAGSGLYYTIIRSLRICRSCTITPIN